MTTLESLCASTKVHPQVLLPCIIKKGVEGEAQVQLQKDCTCVSVGTVLRSVSAKDKYPHVPSQVALTRQTQFRGNHSMARARETLTLCFYPPSPCGPSASAYNVPLYRSLAAMFLLFFLTATRSLHTVAVVVANLRNTLVHVEARGTIHASYVAYCRMHAGQ